MSTLPLLKSDLVNGAYTRGLISGLTSQPSPEEKQEALITAETMAAELEAGGICLNYNFEDQPDLNSPHNMDYNLIESFKVILMQRLLSSFGKKISPALMLSIKNASSVLSSQTATPRETQYQNRMPRGSGNTIRYNPWRRFYREAPVAPNDCETNTMYIGDINVFEENFDTYLSKSEQVQSYTIEANEGLDVLSDSLSNNTVFYEVEAKGNEDGRSSNSYLKIKIIATTTFGRVETRIINFQLLDSRISQNG